MIGAYCVSPERRQSIILISDFVAENILSVIFDLKLCLFSIKHKWLSDCFTNCEFLTEYLSLIY